MIGPAAATFERVALSTSTAARRGRRRRCAGIEDGVVVGELGRPSWPSSTRITPSRFVPVVEDEQLLRAVPLARDVREDALPHVLVLSDALYARFAAW